MNPAVARRIIAYFQQKASVDNVEILTLKGKKVLKALAKGLRYKEAVAQFGLSIETVRSHARNIYEKLHVQSRTEALSKVFGR